MRAVACLNTAEKAAVERERCVDRPQLRTPDDVQMSGRTVEERVAYAKQTRKAFRRDIDISRQYPEWSLAIGGELRVDDVADDAETVVSGFACRHESEIEMAKDIPEVGIDVHRGQPELRRLAGYPGHPQIWSNRECPAFRHFGRLWILSKERRYVGRLDAAANHGGDSRAKSEFQKLHPNPLLSEGTVAPLLPQFCTARHAGSRAAACFDVQSFTAIFCSAPMCPAIPLTWWA